MEAEEEILGQRAPERSLPEYAPLNDELLQGMRPQITPGQALPPTDDSLHFLAMQAAMETAAANSDLSETDDDALYAESQAQLSASAERLQAGHLQEKQEAREVNEDDMQRLTRQADMLAQQRLARQQTAAPANGNGAIMQRVAEETGGQDHLRKEQQIAERAIAAAMAAAKKAAQSAMALSGQRNRQAEENSAEELIASALSKASESGR
jgi:hypothetical protein